MRDVLRRLLIAFLLSLRDMGLAMVTALAAAPGLVSVDAGSRWPVAVSSWAGSAVLLLVLSYFVGLTFAPMDRMLLGVSSGRPMPSPRDPQDTWRQRWASQGSLRETAYGMLLLTLVLAVRLVPMMLLLQGLVLWAMAAFVRPLEWNIGPLRHSGGGGVLVTLLVGLVSLVLGLAALMLVQVGQERLARALLTGWPETERRRAQRLAQSRARLVRGFDAERRRIERDLHDGAQQHLLAIGISLAMALETLDEEHPAREDVQRAQVQSAEAMEELRRLVRGIHPQVLDDHGLAAALRAATEGSIPPVQIRADLPTRPPSHLESTAYMVGSELITNALRHSGASIIDVAITAPPSAVQLTVADDGRGGAAPPSRGWARRAAGPARGPRRGPDDRLPARRSHPHQAASALDHGGAHR